MRIPERIAATGGAPCRGGWPGTAQRTAPYFFFRFRTADTTTAVAATAPATFAAFTNFAFLVVATFFLLTALRTSLAAAVIAAAAPAFTAARIPALEAAFATSPALRADVAAFLVLVATHFFAVFTAVFAFFTILAM